MSFPKSCRPPRLRWPERVCQLKPRQRPGDLKLTDQPLAFAFCINTSLTASPSVPPANSASAGELISASSASKPTIMFTNQSGLLISDAEVVRTNDGVSLVWEKDGRVSGGLVRLEDLPEDLRVRFGYDPAKTAATDVLEKQGRAQWQQAVVAAQAAYLAQQHQKASNQNPPLDDAANSVPSYTSPRNTPAHRHYIRYSKHAEALCDESGVGFGARLARNSMPPPISIIPPRGSKLALEIGEGLADGSKGSPAGELSGPMNLQASPASGVLLSPSG